MRRSRSALPGDVKRGRVGLGEGVGGPVPVAFKGVTTTVEVPAVQLDDQPMVGEERVDLMAGDPDVDERGGQPVVRAEDKKRVLEIRAGRGLVGHCGRQLLSSGMPPVAFQEVEQPGGVDEPLAPRVRGRAAQLAVGKLGRAVEQGAGRAGGADPELGADIGAGQAGGFMGDDAGALVPGWGRDVEREAPLGGKAPEDERRFVAQDGAGATGQDGGCGTLEGERRRATEGVDASMHPKQTLLATAVVDVALRETTLFELGRSDVSMLP
jgi:hypothetical protein